MDGFNVFVLSFTYKASKFSISKSYFCVVQTDESIKPIEIILDDTN